MPTAPKTFKPQGARLAKRATEQRYASTAERRQAHAFYQSAAWRRLRAIVVAEEPCCRECDKHGRTTATEEVDHIEPRLKRPDLAMVRENLQGLCHRCHAGKTRRGG